MKHITIDYGIDLGTTNSSICRMEHGVPMIIRSDSGMNTMPSCVTFKKNGTLNVGLSAYSDLGRSKLRALRKQSASTTDTCIEFKRYMGSDKTYVNSFSEHNWTPEELSAQILKALCSYVEEEDVKAAVITVPAKFTVNQKDATLEAAHLAGLEQVELLQEPIAASMAYGLKAEDKNGIWMVFDLGGGTLDVALVHVSDGIMQVFDTEGDNYLGGKNLDEAIVAKILLPEILSRYVIDTTNTDKMALMTDALKVVAEKLKNTLSYRDRETVYLEAGDWGEDEDGEEIEAEITVTRERLEIAIRPLLLKAVDVCKELMLRNDIPYGRLSHLILIGGPTYIPLLRRMLAQQVTANIDTDIDPMTAVAQGAAIYASTIPLRDKSPDLGNENVLQLEIDFEPTSVDLETYVTVLTQLPMQDLKVKLIRAEDRWETKPEYIGEKGTLLVANLLAGRPNTFIVAATIGGEPVKCFPGELTIIQGTKTGSAILPYNIGIEVYNPKKKRRVFSSLTGLEKNRPLPASGTIYGLKTMTSLYGGDENTKIRIAIYQGDANAEGKTAALFEYVSDIVITGDDVVSFIPEGSLVNLRIDVDRSEMMTVSCEFPQTSQKVEKKLDTSRRQETKSLQYLEELLTRTFSQLRELASSVEGDEELSQLFTKLRMVQNSLVTGVQTKQVEQHLKEVVRSIEDYEGNSQWERCKYSLNKAIMSLQIAGAKHKDDAGITKMIESLTAQAQRVEKLKDEHKAKFLQHQIEEYKYAITRDEIYRDIIRWAAAEFSTIDWWDPALARKLVDKAKLILEKNPNAPLSETKDVTEQFYALIKKRNSESNEYGHNTPRLDILSM